MQPSIAPGTLLQNRYRIVKVLGQGGFGRTYLAEDQGRFNEWCAIKELTPLQSADRYVLEKSKELFQREAQILYQIQHPQVPQFRATFEQEQRFFIAQDYVEGKTFRHLLDERKSQNRAFSEPEILQLLTQVLPILAYLHSKGIIHRDIAPDNIMLRERDLTPVLIDFGVVKELATRIQESGTLRQPTTVGKMGYAPSEQMQTGRAYPNSDLYALAATAIVLLTSREPQDLFDDQRLVWLWQQFAPVSPHLAQVLNRMLSYRFSDRYQSAQEVLQALPSLTPAPPSSAPVQPTQSASALSEPPLQAVAASPPPNPTETMAVARDAETQPAPTATSRRSTRSAPRPSELSQRTSLWDDPWAVFGIGIGLILLTGLGAWTITRTLLANFSSPPKPTYPTSSVRKPSASTAPRPSSSPSSTPSSTPNLTPSAEPSPVIYSQQVTPVAGEIKRSGELRPNQILNFIVPANQDQQLTATLVESEGVLFTILGPNQQPVDDRATRVSNWSGALSYTGSYTVQLKTVKGLPKGDFKLSINVQNASQNSPQNPPTLTPSPLEPPPSPTPPSPSQPPSPIPPSPVPTSPTLSPSPSPMTAPPMSAPRTPSIQPDRVQIPWGQTRVALRSRAGLGMVRRYLMRVQSGQILEIQPDRSGAKVVAIRDPQGQLLRNFNPQKDLFYWRGQVRQGGDYQVEIMSGNATDFTVLFGAQS